MTKKILSLRGVKTDGNIILRSSGEIIEDVDIRQARVLPDERGRLGEIMRADDPWFKKFGQVYFTTTFPGVVKAWHFHKKQTDHFYVIKGTVKVALFDERQESPTHGTVNEVYLGEHSPGLVKIPPGVQHGWMCVGNTESYIINIVSEMYDYKTPDEYRTDPHENHIPYDWTRKDG